MSIFTTFKHRIDDVENLKKKWNVFRCQSFKYGRLICDLNKFTNEKKNLKKIHRILREKHTHTHIAHQAQMTFLFCLAKNFITLFFFC